MKEVTMDFTKEEQLFEFTDKGLQEVSSVIMVSKNKAVQDAEFNNIIQIIDEKGTEEVACTVDKFVEIFDNSGLAGFIM